MLQFSILFKYYRLKITVFRLEDGRLLKDHLLAVYVIVCGDASRFLNYVFFGFMCTILTYRRVRIFKIKANFKQKIK